MQEDPIETQPLTSDEKIWVILSHLSIVIGVGLLLPLIIYLVKRDDSPRAAMHAKEAFNFHISVLIYTLISVVLCFIFIGFILLFIIGFGSLILAIIAALKANEGTLFKYPLTIRFLK